MSRPVGSTRNAERRTKDARDIDWVNIFDRDQRMTLGDRGELRDLFSRAIREAMEDERRVCAAYVLDRADQYYTASPCWHGLADAAHGIMNGEAAEAADHGEFDAKLYARVDGFRGKAPAVRPDDGRED